jgi:hypothetical protein
VFDFWDNRLMQGMTRLERDLWDAGQVTGCLVPPGSVFAFLADHRTELFPDSFTADLFRSLLQTSFDRSQRPSVLAQADREVRAPGPGVRRGRGGDRGDGDPARPAQAVRGLGRFR